jgi:hypothetical protein
LATKLETVLELLRQRGFDFSSSHVELPAFNSVLIEFPRSHIAEVAGKGVVSRRQLDTLATEIKSQTGYQVEFVVNGDSIRHVYAQALQDLLSRKFGEGTYGITVALSPQGKCDVWIDARNATNSVTEEDVRNLVALFLTGIGLASGAVHILIPSTRLPSDMEILRALKIKAPLDPSGLKIELLKGEGVGIDDKWLNSKLDGLRKKGLVCRVGNGKYLLTEIALRLVPVSRSRRSLDIVRALELAKRKW